MTEPTPKTFIVKRTGPGRGWSHGSNEFFVSEGNNTLMRIQGSEAYRDADELEVTIRPRKTKRERWREALQQLFGSNIPTTVVDTALGMLEAIDKEFDGNG